MRPTALRGGAELAIASILIVGVATSFHGGSDPATLQVSCSALALARKLSQ